MPTHAEHNGSDGKHIPSKKSNLLLKGGLTTSALIVTPYIGDALNLSATTVPEIMAALHGHGLGTGLAGGINSLLSTIPYVEETLSAGGIATTASSGIIGIGGILIGNYLDKKPHKEGSIPWGKVIKYAALTTSILIALPSILTGINVGLAYLASFAGASVAGSVMASLSGTIGSIGGMSMATAGAGIGSALTHLITCGGAALSVAGAIYLDKDNDTPTKSSINVEIKGNPTIKCGESCKIEFRISDENGKTVTPDDMNETYTKKLHVMLVDSSLNDYHHVHPEYDKTTGLFTLSFIPQIQGEYSAWSDFTLQKNDSHVILKNKIFSVHDYKIPPVIQHTNSVVTDNINIGIDTNPPLSAGKNSTLTLKVTNKSGSMVKLDPVMGAYAHLVGFSKDGESLIHCHPLNIDPNTNGDLQFHITPEKEGFTKFFLQLKIYDRETVVPFGQYIRPPNIQPSAKFTHRQTTSSYLTTENNLANIR